MEPIERYDNQELLEFDNNSDETDSQELEPNNNHLADEEDE